jgi:hypothetical protein
MKIPRKYRADIESLESKLKLLFDDVGIPLMSFSLETDGITQNFLWEALEKTKDCGKYVQGIHNLVVPLINNEALEILKIPQELRRDACIAATVHDLERIEYPNLVDKKGHFAPEDWTRVRTHPIKARELLLKLGEKRAANIAGLHHAWQENPYPNPIDFEVREEEKFLSQILAITDFYHRASISTNGRIPRTWLEKYIIDPIQRSGKPNPERVEAALRKQYGSLNLVLSKQLKEEIKIQGNQLMNTLYSLGIFGADNPLERYT